MVTSIESGGITGTIITACQTTLKIIVEWSGKAVSLLKAGTEVALPYFQDKRIAVISLIAIDLLLIELAHLFTVQINHLLPNHTEKQRTFRKVFTIVFGVSIIVSGIVGFVKVAKLPLRWEIIVGLTLVTALTRAFFTTPKIEESGSKPLTAI